jgi:hypothetical protein
MRLGAQAGPGQCTEVSPTQIESQTADQPRTASYQTGRCRPHADLSGLRFICGLCCCHFNSGAAGELRAAAGASGASGAYVEPGARKRGSIDLEHRPACPVGDIPRLRHECGRAIFGGPRGVYGGHSPGDQQSARVAPGRCRIGQTIRIEYGHQRRGERHSRWSRSAAQSRHVVSSLPMQGSAAASDPCRIFGIDCPSAFQRSCCVFPSRPGSALRRNHDRGVRVVPGAVWRERCVSHGKLQPAGDSRHQHHV